MAHPDYASVELDHSTNGDDYTGASTSTRHNTSESLPLTHRASNAHNVYTATNPLPRSNSNSQFMSPGHPRTRSVSKAESAYTTYATEPIVHYSKADLIARTPWRQFVTHPVALALLTSSFGYVSSL